MIANMVCKGIHCYPIVICVFNYCMRIIKITKANGDSKEGKLDLI